MIFLTPENDLEQEALESYLVGETVEHFIKRLKKMREK